MFWKAILITTLAIGALAEFQINETQRNQMKEYITAYCKKNGAEDKVDEVMTSITNFSECVMGIFNVETLKTEIENAKPNGALDEVFKKYCAKSPQLKTCIHSMTSGVAPCLDSNIRDEIGFADNATDRLIDFVCNRDGEMIALFIAKGGPECFQEKFNDIRECASKIKDIKNVDEAKKLTLNEQCAKYDEFSTCVVNVLETCSTPTPGNMAESLFRFLRRSTPCPKTD
ncbi:27 kDa hemolymph protein-like [Pararge aegeria]|uniref:Jg7507 protein n=2 Tax=Pararge aegeria TaxID=116150 RepID=A0A8S4RCS7_9NEOP|nr:27 kDa hemolymph protein-like [Pararge aegeria]CAH2235097.1 jg7507 [Pararge aegeria aegeria]